MKRALSVVALGLVPFALGWLLVGGGQTPAPSGYVHPDVEFANSMVYDHDFEIMARPGHAPQAPDPAPAPEAVDFVALPGATADVAGQAELMCSAWSENRASEAALVASQHQNVMPFDEAGDYVQVTATYWNRHMRLEVARRPGVTGPLAVSFPPGTMGRHQQQGDYQDLALLRAKVVVLEAGVDTGVAESPVACAGYTMGTPVQGIRYDLDRFAAGSQSEALMQVLCQGSELPADAPAQMAVWAVVNQVRADQFEERWVTFRTHESIRWDSADEAMRMVAQAGIPPASVPLFQGRVTPEFAPWSQPQQERADPTEATPALGDVQF